MTNAQGGPLMMTLLPIANGYGDNTLVWEPQGVTAGTTDTVYHVQVSNVIVGSAAKNYSYDVIIIKPSASSAAPASDFSPQLGEAPLP